MAFDYIGAIKEGYTPQEIADFLGKQSKFDVAGARNEGYSDQEIIRHLAYGQAMGTPSRADAPGALASVGAGLNDIYQALQYGSNKLGSLVPGSIGRMYAQNEANRVAQQQANESGYQYGRQQSGQTGFDWNRLTGAMTGSLPLGGVTAAPFKLAGAGAEALGLGTTAATAEGQALPYLTNTGLAGGLNQLGSTLATGGGAAGLGTRIGAGLTEGTGQGALFGGGQGNAPAGAAVGGAVGAGIPVIGSALGTAAGGTVGALRNWFNRTAAAARGELSPSVTSSDIPHTNGDALNASLNDMGLTPDALSARTKTLLSAEANKQADTIGTVDHDALARKALMTELGLTPTNAMVSRDPIEWAQEREAAKDPKFGVPLMAAITGNARKINNGLGDLVDQTGGQVTTPHQVGEQISDALTNRYTELGKGITAEYGKVRDTTGQDLASNGQNLVNTMGPLSDTVAGQPLVDATTRRMQRMGLMDNEGTLTGKTLNIDQSEELRKFINQNIDQRDPGSMWAGRQLLAAHDQDVADGASGDAFANARALFKDRQAEFDNTPHQGILNGKVAPQDIVNRYLINGKVNDVSALKNTLQATPEGQQAWDNARASVADWIQQQATGGKGADGLTFDRLNRAIQSIGPEKMQTLFPDTAANYQQWLKGTQFNSLTPGEAPVNRSNTASALLHAASSIGNIPGMETIPGSGLAVKKGIEGFTGMAQRAKVKAMLEGTAVNPQAQAAAKLLAEPQTAVTMPGSLAGLVGLGVARPSESASP